LRADAGNVEVAATAVGFTSMFFIIVVLAAALMLGYGRKSAGSRRASGRGERNYGKSGYSNSRGYGDSGGRAERPVASEVPLVAERLLLGDLPLRIDTPTRGMRSVPSGRPVVPREKPVPDDFQAGGKFGVSQHPDRIAVEVNPSKCARFGFCEHEAPDVFYLESDGRFGYQASVSVEKMEQVISAVDVCPRRAIKVKLPPAHAEARVRPAQPPAEEGRLTILPGGLPATEAAAEAPVKPRRGRWD
jgi:ferredoxin